MCTRNVSQWYNPVKNRLERNIQILQVFLLQDLQDLALNLTSLALKMKLFLQDMKNLARKMQDNFLARFLQDFSYLARKALFLVQDLQHFVQDLAKTS